MATIKNNTKHLITWPDLKCTETGRVLEGVRLFPGFNTVPDEYLKQALGGAGDDQFVFKAKAKDEKGHLGVKESYRFYCSGGSEIERAAPDMRPDDLGSVTIAQARELIEKETDQDILIGWYIEDERKGIHELLRERAQKLGVMLPDRAELV